MTERPLSEVLRAKWDQQTRQEALPAVEAPGAYWAEVYDRAPGKPGSWETSHFATTGDAPNQEVPIPGFESVQTDPTTADEEIISRVFPMDDLPGLLADPCPWEFVATGEYLNRQLGLTFKHEPGATQGVLTGPQHIVMGS